MSETIQLTKYEFDNLLEYSMSLPTGTTFGKRWKRDLNVYEHNLNGPGPDWWMGEYFELPSDQKNITRINPGGDVGIRWYKIEIMVARRTRLRSLLAGMRQYEAWGLLSLQGQVLSGSLYGST